MLFKLSHLNSNLALTLGYLNPALKNSALGNRSSFFSRSMCGEKLRQVDIFLC